MNARIREPEKNKYGILADFLYEAGHVDDETRSLAISLYKAYRGLGIGISLMKEMLTYLSKAGYQRVSLSVQKENYACRMYEKLGFQVVLEWENEWIMQKQL